MRGTEEHIGVIRDKPGIYAGLVQSQATGQQLAICYRQDDKLIVKICLVKEVTGDHNGAKVVLHMPEHPTDELRVELEQIESIYPIRDYQH